MFLLKTASNSLNKYIIILIYLKDICELTSQNNWGIIVAPIRAASQLNANSIPNTLELGSKDENRFIIKNKKINLSVLLSYLLG